jgi:hypothetical protein
MTTATFSGRPVSAWAGCVPAHRGAPAARNGGTGLQPSAAAITEVMRRSRHNRQVNAALQLFNVSK